MLGYNNEHKVADLSTIRRSKKGKAIYMGKILLYGVALSSFLLLSGCSRTYATDRYNTGDPVPGAEPIATIIVFENGNAKLMDLCDFTYNSGDIFSVHDMEGNHYVFADDYSMIINGEGSHERAEEWAYDLVGENGKVTWIDEKKSNVKTRKSNRK